MPELDMTLHPASVVRQWSRQTAPMVLERAAVLGYSRVLVTIRDPYTFDPEEFIDLFEAAGVAVMCSGSLTVSEDISSDDPAVRELGARRVRALVDTAAALGADQLCGLLYGPLVKAEVSVGEERFRRTARALGEVAEYAGSQGVRLACEVVNRYETPLLNTAEQAVRFVEEAGSPHLGIHLDTYHMHIEEADPGAAILLALPHLFYLELGQSNRGSLRAGTVRFAELIATAVRAGYRGRFGVEAFSASMTDPAIAGKLAIWRDVFDEENTIPEDAIDLVRSALAASTP